MSRSLHAVLSIALVLVWCFAAAPVSAQPFQARRVLLLNSYSLDYAWTENIVSGVRSALQTRQDVQLDIEFMNTKKAWTPALAEQLAAQLQARYAGTRFDAVITSDDDAFNFVLARRAQLFPGAPLVFCGLNDYTPARIAGQAAVTGVAEEIAIADTYRFILEHHPGLQRIVVLHDASATGKAVASKLGRVAAQLAPHVRTEYLTDLEFAALGSKLSGLDSHTILIWGVFFRDTAGVYLPAERSTELVARSTRVPVYTFWDFAVHGGVLGGKVVSGLQQGQHAAAMVLQILSGTSAAAIPVEQTSPNVFVFDYAALTRHGLASATLPAGSVILGKPASFYEANRAIVHAALGAFGVETLALVALVLLVGRVRRKSQHRIHQLNRGLQSVLDSMQEPLLVCDTRGVLTEVHSHTAALVFGPVRQGEYVWNYLHAHDEQARDALRLAFEQLAEGALPTELALDQMPAQLQHARRHYAASYHRVDRQGVLAELVVVLEDITDKRAQEKTELFYRSLPHIVGHLLRDREAFLNFMREIDELLVRLGQDSDPIEQNRHLHTLKGNTAMYGFAQLSSMCHAREERLRNDAAPLAAAEIHALGAEWRSACEQLQMFLGQDEQTFVRLRELEYNDLLERLTRRDDYLQILEAVLALRRPLVSQIFAPHVSAAQRLASRLGKQLRVVTPQADLRLPSSALRAFCQTLVHVVRNAVDHGVESAAERATLGKAPIATLKLDARHEREDFVISIEDDGRGIDWAKLRVRAHAQGVLDESGPLSDALFIDGVTTKDQASDISGRGVGLAAVRQSALSLGGQIEVLSELGHGTTFRFRFPQPKAASGRRTSRPPPRAAGSTRGA